MFNTYSDVSQCIATAISVVLAGLDAGHGAAWMRAELRQRFTRDKLLRAAAHHARRHGLPMAPPTKAEWRMITLAVDAALRAVKLPQQQKQKRT